MSKRCRCSTSMGRSPLVVGTRMIFELPPAPPPCQCVKESDLTEQIFRAVLAVAAPKKDGLILKAAGDRLTAMLSNERRDRAGDVLVQAGLVWSVESVTLHHDFRLPVGQLVRTWRETLPEDGAAATFGEIQLAPEGTSVTVDEARGLIASGALRAVSIEFLPLASEPLPADLARGHRAGVKYVRAEVTGLSFVSTPACRECVVQP